MTKCKCKCEWHCMSCSVNVRFVCSQSWFGDSCCWGTSTPNYLAVYSGSVFVLTQCISVWYRNSSNQDCKALQRVVRLAERISGSTLPSLQDIYLKCCKGRAAKIIKDSNHPGNHLFCLLPSGRRYRSMMAKTERLRRSFFPQAP